MTIRQREYFILINYFLVSFARAIIRLYLGYTRYIFNIEDSDTSIDQLVAYECGFSAFNDARHQVEIRYYIRGIMFLVFDLEGSYIFPWSTIVYESLNSGYYTIVDFMVELLVAYVYGWIKKAIEWN